jgi:hypothetical protein
MVKSSVISVAESTASILYMILLLVLQIRVTLKRNRLAIIYCAY